MRFLAPSSQSYDTLLRIARSSFAEPPWFAVLIDATEDDDALTLVFELGGGKKANVRAELHDQELRLSGTVKETPARRVCVLSFKVPGNEVEATRSGEQLRVRIPKSRRSVSPKTPVASEK